MGLAIQDAGPVIPDDKSSTPADQQVVAPPRPDRTAEARDKARTNVLEQAAKDRAATTAGEPAAATAEIKIDADALAQITKLSAENRKMAERLKALEGVEPKAKQFDDVMSKATSLERVSALGVDVEELVKELLAQEDASGTPENKQLAAVEKKLGDIAERLEKSEKDREAERTAVTAEDRAAATGEVTEHIRGLVQAEPQRWPLASARKSTASDATKIAVAVASKLGRAVGDDEARKIYFDALDQIEQSHRDDLVDSNGDSGTMSASGASTAPNRERPQPRPAPTIDGSISRGAPPAASNGVRKHMTEKEARALALENMRRQRR